MLSKDAAAAIGSATSALASGGGGEEEASLLIAGDEDFTDPGLLRAVDADDISALQADLTTYRIPLALSEQAIYEKWNH